MRWLRGLGIASVVVAPLGLLIAAQAASGQTQPDAATEPRPARATPEQGRAFVRTLLVKSPYRIPMQARSGEIRYWLAFEPGRAWAWPETGEQHVATVGERTELRICDSCGREPAPTPDTLQRYREPNAWVRSDDKRIRAFARMHTQGGSVAARMRRLTIAVRAHMTGAVEFHRYDDAVTALETRSGDCTEYAMLLAASARALGIPARLAHGIAYSSRFTGETDVFSPHVWVQVWDGQRWRSYDAGFARFDAGHIALYIGDGRPEGLQALAPAIRTLRVMDAAGILPPPQGRTN